MSAVLPGCHVGTEAPPQTAVRDLSPPGAVRHQHLQALDGVRGAALLLIFIDHFLVTNDVARNPVLSRLLENVYAQILVLRLRSLYLPERVESSVAEHREIFEAVLAGDAERGERLARAHAEHVLQDALEFTRRAERDR